jgi:hypothetical protein
MGIIISNSFMKWLDPKAVKLKQCNTTCFDEFKTHLGDDTLMHGAFAIGGSPLATTNLVPVKFNMYNNTFFDDTP